MVLSPPQAQSVISSLTVGTLWYTRCPVPTASSLAIQQGWLDEEFLPDGIEVASLRQSDQRAVRESHFSHTQANSFRQGGNIPPIWARSQGQDLQLIGLSWAEQYQAILALPESRIRSAQDLRGRRLALPQRIHDPIDFWRATSLRGYLSALELVGLSEKEVEFVDLSVAEPYITDLNPSHTGPLFTSQNLKRLQSTEVFALIRGEVDAIYVSGGRGAELQAFLGAVVVTDLGRHPDPAVRINNITPAALTVSGSLVRERPDLVTRYVTRLLEAAAWAEIHPHLTKRIIAAEVGVAEEWVDLAYPSDLHTHLTPELSEQSIAAIESQKNFLLKWGFIQQDFDLRSWVNSEPLEAAKRRFH
ncbi:MAG: ABC transporter substrate-binding protein [Cyanobacteriota bacterium]|nr:ABC transporter substrate-binding protein [Cyanobacteriota bacterium]